MQYCLAYFAWPVCGMVAISLVQPLLLSRNLLMIPPAFLLLVAVCLYRLLPEGLLTGGPAALVLLAMPGLSEQLSTPRTADFRRASNLIAAKAVAGDAVLFFPAFNQTVFEYYVRGRHLQFRWCRRLWAEIQAKEVFDCPRDTRRLCVMITGDSGFWKKAIAQSWLGEAFRPVRSDEFREIRVDLYERVR